MAAGIVELPELVRIVSELEHEVNSGVNNFGCAWIKYWWKGC